jgi:hypothetical protein
LLDEARADWTGIGALGLVRDYLDFKMELKNPVSKPRQQECSATAQAQYSIPARLKRSCSSHA